MGAHEGAGQDRADDDYGTRWTTRSVVPRRALQSSGRGSVERGAMNRRIGRRGPEDERVPVPVEGYTLPEWECERRKMVRALLGDGGLNERDRERLRVYLEDGPDKTRRSRDPVEAARLRKERQRLLEKVRALIGDGAGGRGTATNGNHSNVTLSGLRGRIASRMRGSEVLSGTNKEGNDGEERKKERKKEHSERDDS